MNLVQLIFSKLAYTLIPRVAGYNNASADEYDFKEYDMDIRNVPEFSSVSVKIVLKTKKADFIVNLSNEGLYFTLLIGD